MRSSRKQLLEEGKSGYLHVMNRVVGREFFDALILVGILSFIFSFVG